MRVKNRSISLLFLLILTFLSACGATAASEDDIKNKAENVEKEAVYSSSESGTDHPDSPLTTFQDAGWEKRSQIIEAEEKEAGNKSSSHREIEDRADELDYLDFKGDYVLYQVEPHHSQVVGTLLLEEDYVEWEGVQAYVQKYEIQENRLELTAVQQVKDSSPDQVSHPNAYHLHYTLDYWDPHKVIIDHESRVYYQQPEETEGIF